MKDDKDLMTRCGKENPFRTPEGYFEHFNERLMTSLPEIESPAIGPVHISLFTRIKPWLYMAAMFVSTIFIVQGLMYVQKRHLPDNTSTLAEEIYTEEADHFMSSSLYNEYALYSYLTSNENN